MKLNIMKQKTSQEAEENGIPFIWGGITFLVRRLGGTHKFYKKFQKELAEFVSQYQGIDNTQKENGNVQLSVNEAVAEKMTELTAKYLIADWEGVINEEDGKAVDFNVDIAVEILKELPDLSVAIQNFANNRNRFICLAESIKKK